MYHHAATQKQFTSRRSVFPSKPKRDPNLERYDRAKRAKVVKTVRDGYKDGYVECNRCGWHLDLGPGYQKYLIQTCPSCDIELYTETTRKVVTGESERDCTAELGTFFWFGLDNGVWIVFKKVLAKTLYHIPLADTLQL